MTQYKHYLEASTEIWMRGGNPDNLSHDRADNNYYRGYSPEDTARGHMRQEQDRRDRIRDYEQEEIDYREFHEQEYEEPTPTECDDSDLPF